jgi:hypothetical protein
MAKLGLFASLASIVAAIAVCMASAPRAAAADDAKCVHAKLETQLIRAACAQGGQPAAKDAMKTFMKAHHLSTCNACHATLAPSYELKADGLAQLQRLGGT